MVKLKQKTKPNEECLTLARAKPPQPELSISTAGHELRVEL